MKNANALSKALQTDNIKYVRSHYGFWRTPSEIEFLTALAHNAHQCIAFMTPRYFRTTPHLSIDLLQTAAQNNRVDVLRSAAATEKWNVFSSSLGLHTPHCGLEAAHFFLDQWEGTTSKHVENWNANLTPSENPRFPQLEDGPFTLARLSEKPELFNRLTAICRKRADIRKLVQDQLMQTTRIHYSHSNFDSIFIQSCADVFFKDENYCWGLLKKSVEFTFPSPISVLVHQTDLKKAAQRYIPDLCALFFEHLDKVNNDSFVWANAKGLLDVNRNVFCQHWARFYFNTVNCGLRSVENLNGAFIKHAPEAVHHLLQDEPKGFAWDSNTAVGSAVVRRKLQTSLASPQTTVVKHKKKM